MNSANAAIIKLAQALQTGGAEVLESISGNYTPILKMKPDYQAQSLMSLPTMFRYDEPGFRRYFEIISQIVETIGNSIPSELTDKQIDAVGKQLEQIVNFFPSVTTITSKTLPTSAGLLKMRGEMGNAGFYDFMRRAGDKGTFIHMLMSDYLKYSELNFRQIPEKLALFAEETHINYEIETRKNIREIEKKTLSLINFCETHNVRPLLIEGTVKYHGYTSEVQHQIDFVNEMLIQATKDLETVKSDNASAPAKVEHFEARITRLESEIKKLEKQTISFAGTMDLLCEMNIEVKGFWGELYKSGDRKGQPKETKKTISVIALVDFKSGLNFFDEYGAQLYMYKMAAEQSLGIKIDKLYNVRPTDWKTEPNFAIKDQTEYKHADQVPHMLMSFFSTYEEPKNILKISGVAKRGESLNGLFSHEPAADHVLKISKTQYELEKQQEVVSAVGLN